MSKGPHWQIEAYETAEGKVPLADFLKDLRKGPGNKAVDKVQRSIDLLGDLGFSAPRDLVKKVRGDLWELRATHQRNPYRILFYNRTPGRTLVLLHAFHKKDEAIAQRDIDLAVRRMEDDRRRNP